ncbi:MAG: hypothetical protein H3C30_19295 [Candidatus Hydrogenedentes bacterium]|nr:hypothetical protein [Candidatus Hydrogenedentota bacterium]
MSEYLIYRHGSNAANQHMCQTATVAIVEARNQEEAKTLAAQKVTVYNNQHLEAVPRSRARTEDWNDQAMQDAESEMTRQEARQRIEDAAHDIGPDCHAAWAGSCRQDKEEAVNRVVDGVDPGEVAGEFLR